MSVLFFMLNVFIGNHINMEVLKIGDRGDAVKTLQVLLIKNGFNISADGIFGAGTEDIVETFQLKNKLTVDGIVGKSTWDILLGNNTIKINNDRFVLPLENYYQEPFAKKAIVLHDTNGWTVKNGKPSMNHFYWWKSHYGANNGNARVATAFSIDYDGNIYQHFDPSFWAYHLGLGAANNFLDKQSIGIELVNEGRMSKDDSGNYFWHSGEAKIPYNRPNDEPVFVKNAWRGFYYFAPYSQKQINSTLWLVKHLIDKYGIKMNFIEDNEYHPEILSGFEGIYTHANVRDYPSSKPKWDLSPAFPFKDFKKELFGK